MLDSDEKLLSSMIDLRNPRTISEVLDGFDSSYGRWGGAREERRKALLTSDLFEVCVLHLISIATFDGRLIRVNNKKTVVYRLHQHSLIQPELEGDHDSVIVPCPIVM